MTMFEIEPGDTVVFRELRSDITGIVRKVHETGALSVNLGRKTA